MRTLLIVCAFFSLPHAFAQHALITEHTWDEKPTIPDTVQKLTDAQVILRRDHIVQFADEGQNVVEYALFHYACFLRDDAAIDGNNTMHIGLSGVHEVVSIKARSIAPDGKVMELKADAFKRADDEEEHETYLYFAYEGLVPGSVIEYVSVLKKDPEMRGKREQVQFEVPVLAGSFDLIAPTRLVFAVKNYNGAPAPVLDSTDTDQQHFHLQLRNVPGLKDEPSAASTASRMQLVYKLDKVLDRDLKDVSGYVGATKLYHGALYPELTPRTQKDISALVKDMGLTYARNDEDRVRTMEQYIKSHFQLVQGGKEMSELPTILKQRAANKTGLTILFCNVLRTIDMEHQVVINNERSTLPFDGQFESYLNLNDIFIYLPKLDRYLAPTEFGLRFGWLPAWNMENDALFIRNYDIGGTITGVGKVKHINALADSLNSHDIYANVIIGPDGGTAEIDFENRLTGYYAEDLQVYYGLLTEEVRAQVHSDMLGYILDNSTKQEVTSENAEGEFMGVRPWILKAKVSTTKFSGSAGDKVLFNIGELIGPQVEMYTEHERQLPVDDGYNRRFYRELKITLPEGYTLQNAADLAMDQHLDLDGDRALIFKSTYELNGRELKVVVLERYKRCILPVEHYEAYRKVVNAAADFNKVKLVLVKG